ncbi:MAG TPA: hypothetical protein P5102_08500 [Candidatus Competibacteraceae bacterium]|nr:hypothetical protein [Candidatus Competibacteraceae bacterium]HRZ06180.1 hypothetical protein [Candidatus Competibacteraceae bacterium]HSA46175.1 hypothetical protein [Candidatus Competibacteraceae bacterium]
MDEQELIQNPEALLALIQQAVQYVIEQRPDTAAQEAQLRAVAKAIEQLEKQQVPVPDSLRQTKMTLVAEINQETQCNHQLIVLGDGLTEVLEIIESVIGQASNNDKASITRPRRRKSNGSRTSRKVLQDYVLAALTDLGGSAHSSEVLDRIHQLFGEKLLLGDMDYHKDYDVIWRYNVQWAYQKLIHDGVACRSTGGYWKLAENPL